MARLPSGDSQSKDKELPLLDVADQLAIHQLIALYGHIVDERQFSRVGEMFSPTIRYDMTDFGAGVLIGPQAVVDYWSLPTTRHPLVHLTTNVVISVESDGTVRVASKGVGIGYGGKAGSVTYLDIVEKIDDRWLMVERRCKLRDPSKIPEIS
jgi:hypothetical protein